MQRYGWCIGMKECHALANASMRLPFDDDDPSCSFFNCNNSVCQEDQEEEKKIISGSAIKILDISGNPDMWENLKGNYSIESGKEILQYLISNSPELRLLQINKEFKPILSYILLVLNRDMDVDYTEVDGSMRVRHVYVGGEEQTREKDRSCSTVS